VSELIHLHMLLKIYIDLLVYLNSLLTSFFPYLFTSLLFCIFENRPILFQGWRLLKATKPDFSFFMFISCCNVLCYKCMFAFIVFDLVSEYESRDCGTSFCDRGRNVRLS